MSYFFFAYVDRMHNNNLKLYHNIKSIINPSLTNNMTEVELLKKNAILVESNKIIEIGSTEELQKNYDVEENQCFNMGNRIIIPGLIDPHTHPVFKKTREEEFVMRLKGHSYEEIAANGGGILNSVKSLRDASEQELFELSLKRVKTFLEYGTTTIEAKSGYGLSFKDEVKSLNVIKKLNNELALDLIPTFLGAHEIPEEYRNNRGKYIDLVINEMIPYVSEEKLAVYCDVFCEKTVFNIEETERIILAAKKNNLKVRLHADELYPLGGAELAAKHKISSADHLLQISDQGISDLKEAGVTPILLPGTAFFIRKKDYAPARKMIDSGCQIALATDYNPGSSYTQNLQFIMSLSCLNMGMLPKETFNAVTKNAAESLDKYDLIGKIAKGYQADFISLEVDSIDQLVYNYAVNQVKSVIKNGKIIIEN